MVELGDQLVDVVVGGAGQLHWALHNLKLFAGLALLDELQRTFLGCLNCLVFVAAQLVSELAMNKARPSFV